MLEKYSVFLRGSVKHSDTPITSIEILVVECNSVRHVQPTLLKDVDPCQALNCVCVCEEII